MSQHLCKLKLQLRVSCEKLSSAHSEAVLSTDSSFLYRKDETHSPEGHLGDSDSTFLHQPPLGDHTPKKEASLPMLWAYLLMADMAHSNYEIGR